MGEPSAILHVVDCLNVGGTERQLFELLRRMDRKRFRPLLATFKAGGELLGSLRSIGIEPVVFPLRGSLAQANTAIQVARMARLIRKENVRVVHAHDFYSNVIGVAAASLAGARSIASRRDLAHWLGGTQRKALRFACRMADAVVANAAAVAEQTERELAVAAAKMRVIPNGIDVENFDMKAFRTPDPLLPAGDVAIPRVCMVGSMHLPDKGHADLLKAAAILKARNVRAQFLLVSDGALRKELEDKARALGVGDDVFFLGRRDDVPSLLVRSDIVAHPSWSEGFPNAVLEAMCAARPVVATRVGGIPEVMRDGEHGILVAPERPAELASALEKLITHSLAGHVMGLRGRKHVEEVYSLDRMYERTAALYDELAGGAVAHEAPLAVAG
jgi:L-malate glycosyltransferase